MSPSRIWIVLALLYALFFGWYTSFGGPLDAEEVEEFIGVMRENGIEADQLARWRHFLETDTGDDFVMFNAIDLRETPLQIEGVAPGETSAEVLSRYTQPFMGRALRSGAHPVFLGSAAAPALDLWGIEGASDWTMAGLIRYRSRRDLMEQARAIGPEGIHDFKTAAMEKTIAFPVDPFLQLGDPRLVLGLALAIIGLCFHLRDALARVEPA